MTAEPSVRDRAAVVVARTLVEGTEGLIARAEGIADALAAAGPLAEDVKPAAECTDPTCRNPTHYVLR